jgi:Swt1-like HEPN/AAA domain
LTSDNPYAGRGAPVSGNRLVGRAPLLNRLMVRAQSGAHCSIVGLPRMGKTSVARECIRLMQSAPVSAKGGYITLDAVRGPIQAYSRIVEETAPDALERVLPRTANHDEAYEDFLRILRKRRRAGSTSVVVVDEIDAIARDGFADAPLFVSRIREVANDCERYGVTFMFVSRRSLDMIQGAVDCSTLAGLCEVMYMQPLERSGLNSLAERSQRPVEPSGLEALWRITGGHPFLAEVVMCEAFEMGNLPLDGNIIEIAQHLQSHEFTNQYRQLARLVAQDGMFDVMCELVVGPRWRDVSPHAVSLLKHYGVLRSSGQAVGGLECMSQHLREYLMLLTRTTPTWELLGDAERQLRALIQDRMACAYGENWWDTFRSKTPNLSEAMEKLVLQRSREVRQFGDAASDFILDYAYIGDLKDIVFAEWDRFRSVLGGSKADWERRFQDIMKVRNPLAHHRPVPADVLQDAERSCKSLLARLTSNSSND